MREGGSALAKATSAILPLWEHYRDLKNRLGDLDDRITADASRDEL